MGLPAAVLQAAAREAERIRLEREVQRKEYEAQQVGVHYWKRSH